MDFNQARTADVAVEFLWKSSGYDEHGLPLRMFHNALFTTDAMWICGWNKKSCPGMDLVLLNVQGQGYDVDLMNTLRDPEAYRPIIMFTAGDLIIFASKYDSEIYSFHTKTHMFQHVYSSSSLTLCAMCGNERNV